MQLIERIVATHQDILELYDRSLEVLNAPKDTDLDGVDDLDFLDKWKHAQILLGLTKETAKIFDLFAQVMGEDALLMDDSGRIEFIKETHKGLLRIKSAMRLELRRINKEIYQYRRLQKEAQVFQNLFQ